MEVREEGKVFRQQLTPGGARSSSRRRKSYADGAAAASASHVTYAMTSHPDGVSGASREADDSLSSGDATSKVEEAGWLSLAVVMCGGVHEKAVANTLHLSEYIALHVCIYL